ncbi:MAG: protein-L-isoaspartate(D-aspartate) O-methyltransferase [Chloroflexota bacterium]
MSWIRSWRRWQGRPRPPDDASAETDPTERARERMVREQIEKRGVRDPEVLSAMRRVPRHLFVDSAWAYDDRALPLTHGQTISQPFVVALMTQAARPARGWHRARVLEIGTGSGYQAAVLAELGAAVVSVERDPELSAQAARNLAAAGYGGVVTEVGDGTQGWPAGGPYDAILVTAAGPSIPAPLREQLNPAGGRMVIPIGDREGQWLTLVERHDNEWRERSLEPVVFVPLIGTHGYGEGRID